MKYTLAFTIYNKEKWVESILDSWLENATNINEIEVIIVFDDLKDNSKLIAERCLSKYNITSKFLYADDKHEIFCNNLALENASGDYIIFIQDDNWIYDKNWDGILTDIFNDKKMKIGAVALLAGAKILNFSFKSDILYSYYRALKFNLKSLLTKRNAYIKPELGFRYERLEIDRTSKKNNFSIHKIKSLPLGIWTIHHITRPFCINRKLILELGGLDKFFMPHMGDDVDLSYKLLQLGYLNIYIPFNLLNISTVADSDKHGYLFVIHSRIISELRKRYPEVIKHPNKYPIMKVRDLFLNSKNDSITISENE